MPPDSRAEEPIGTLTLTLPSEPESGGVARRELEAFLDPRRIDPMAVLLAVSEAITNAVVHGYRADDHGSIEVSATQDADGVTVVVSDRGVGMSPNPRSEGLGFGMSVMGAFADSVQVEAVHRGGTKVTMRFAQGSPDG
jgi:anti-sigma regulatory factor (Ser/Thr protein kinase)